MVSDHRKHNFEEPLPQFDNSSREKMNWRLSIHRLLAVLMRWSLRRLAHHIPDSIETEGLQRNSSIVSDPTRSDSPVATVPYEPEANRSNVVNAVK